MSVDPDPNLSKVTPKGLADLLGQGLVSRSDTPEIVVLLEGKEIARKLLDRSPIKVGRQPDNDLVLTDRAVSRQHAVIVREAGQWWIRDAGSRHKLGVGADRFEALVLKHGARVRIGPFELCFESPVMESALPSLDAGAAGVGAEAGDSPELVKHFPSIEGYEITGHLGEGGMGSVWRAVQLSTRREVALKLLGLSIFGSEKARARFQREVELTARLSHPHIARIYDSGLHHGAYFYAMELIDGEHLDTFVRKHGYTQRQVLETFRVVCLAVQHAHQRGVIHRDLKPSNVLVTEDAQPHILDFGLAKGYLDGDSGSTISIPGEVAGTPAYMAPEQAAGHLDRIDTRTDVYSLGVILFRLLTGQSPHDLSGSRFELLRRITEEEVRRPRGVSAAVDRELEALLLKALAHDPDGRYATAAELAQDIDNYLRGEPLIARSPTTVYFLRKRLRRYRVPLGIGCLFLCALVGVAAYSYVRIARERTNAIVARDETRRQAQLTEAARLLSEQERHRAEEQAANARREAEATRRALYFNRVSLAYAEYQQSNILGVWRLLDDCPKDLRGWEWFYLRNNHDESVLTLRCPDGHAVVRGSAFSMRFSPNGALIACKWSDQAVTLYDARSGSRTQMLPSQKEEEIKTFSLDNKRLLGTMKGGGVIAWDIATGGRITPREGDDRAVSEVVASKERAEKEAERHGLGTYRGFGNAALSPEGKQLCAAHPDGSVRLIDVGSGAELRAFRGFESRADVVLFSPDARLIATNDERRIRLWDAATGELKRTFQGHAARIVDLAFSADGQWLASSSRDWSVKLWLIGADAKPRSVQGHGPVAFSPDGSRIAFCGKDDKLRLWDTHTGRELMVFDAPAPQVSTEDAVAFGRDGSHIILRCLNRKENKSNTISVFDVVTGARLSSCEMRGAFCGMASLGDARRIVTWAGHIAVWDGQTGAEILSLEDGDRKYADIHLAHFASTQDGKRVVAATREGNDSRITVWDVSSGRKLFDGKIMSVWSPPGAVFSPDGSRIISGQGDGTIAVWDVVSGKLLKSLRQHPRPIMSIAVSPDGRRFVSADEGGSIKIWDSESFETIITLKHPKSWVGWTGFSPDGRYMVSAGFDIVTFWDRGALEETGPLTPDFPIRD